MARFLTVNDFSGSPPVPRGNQDFNLDPEPADADSEVGVEADSYGPAAVSDRALTAGDGGTSAIGKNRNDQGPCLYFGPRGQRCSRSAVASGFCARHVPAQLGQSAPSSAALPATARKSRIVAIGLVALVILDNLWPIISEAFREIIRLLHAH